MKDHEIRKTIAIRRLSYASLLKVYYFGGAGILVPFSGLALLIAVFAPDRVHLREGETMLQFVLVVLALMVLWPLFFAFIFATAAWLAIGLKSLFTSTSVVVVQDDRDLAP